MLTIAVITGSSSSKHCTTNEVGMGSKLEDFLAERDILNFLTSSTERVLNSVNETSTLREIVASAMEDD